MTTDMQEKILQYYAGKLQKDEVVEMFRELVKTDAIWQLPSSFLDTAGTLWDAGYIGPPRNRRGLDA